MIVALRASIRRDCSANLRRFIRKQTSIAHGLVCATNDNHDSRFASYFWRNDRWAKPVRRSPSREFLSRATIEEHTSPVPTATNFNSTALSSYPPSLSSVSYKGNPPLTLKRLLSVYSQLSKSRLTVLVVLTAMSSVALSPLPTSVPVLLSTALGTALCSASANTFNQVQEVPYDAQMTRTRGRPLVRRAISQLHATGFGLTSGVAGTVILWTCTNPVTALLGAGNIALYAGAYTYLKRRSVINTWVGAIVGGLPPLMGWTACGGHLLPSASYPISLFLPSFISSTTLPLSAIDNPLAPLALFLFLFSWQFPHFNAFSHLVRESYAQAGYHMLCVLNPRHNALVALRYSIFLIPLCSVLFPLSGLTTWWFSLTSLVPNVICLRYSWHFWRTCGEKAARKLFYGCLWYLPVMMGLMMVHKNGLDWTSWLKLNGASDEDKRTAAVS